MRFPASFEALARSPLALALVACALSIVAITFPSFWLLAPVALAAFFLSLLRAPSWRTAALSGLLFGLATGGAGIWWFWDTLPLDWLGLKDAGKGWWLVFFSWGPVTLMFGLVTAVGTLLLHRIRRLPLAALGFALGWALLEEARMWGFSILTYAERGLLGPHFSAQSIGYPLAESSYFLQLASIDGVFTLNLVTALAGACGAFALARDFSFRSLPAFPALAVAVLLPLILTEPSPAAKPIEVALGYSNIPVGTIHADNQFVQLLTQAAHEAPAASLYVLPEEKRLNSPLAEPETQAAYGELFGEREALIISSKHVPGEPSGQNIVLRYENARGELLGTYAKRMLMPGGEYMPHAMLAVFSLAPDVGLDGYLENLPLKAAPKTDLVAVPLGEHRVGGLICSDFLSPVLNRELARDHGADILVNSANPAWFHGSQTLYAKTLQISKVHAVENRSYYLQASNGAPSFAIDPRGRLLAESPAEGSGILRVPL